MNVAEPFCFEQKSNFRAQLANLFVRNLQFLADFDKIRVRQNIFVEIENFHIALRITEVQLRQL